MAHPDNPDFRLTPNWTEFIEPCDFEYNAHIPEVLSQRMRISLNKITETPCPSDRHAVEGSSELRNGHFTAINL